MRSCSYFNCPLILVAASQNASHAAIACGTSGNYFDGFYHDSIRYPSYQYEGASAYIVVRDGALCSSGSGNFTNAWVMISSGADGNGWGQSGFIRRYGQPLQWFFQFARDANADGQLELETRFSTDATGYLGTRKAFRVLWVPLCSNGHACLRASVDGFTWLESTFNPYGSGWGWPWQPQFFGEARYRETDIPGNPSAHTAFCCLGAQLVSNDQLVNMSCTMQIVNQSSRWANVPSSCLAFDIWTK